VHHVVATVAQAVHFVAKDGRRGSSALIDVIELQFASVSIELETELRSPSGILDSDEIMNLLLCVIAFFESADQGESSRQSSRQHGVGSPLQIGPAIDFPGRSRACAGYSRAAAHAATFILDFKLMQNVESTLKAVKAPSAAQIIAI